MTDETVDVQLDHDRSATIALRSIVAVVPESILVPQVNTIGKYREVVTIRIDGGAFFHVDPNEGERVRRLWKEWTKR